MYLLDTDHLVILQSQSPLLNEALLARIADRSGADFFVSIVSFHEQVAGWQAYLGRRREAAQVVRAYQEFAKILACFASTQIAEFDHGAADQFSELRRQGVRIGTMDLRIASIALAHDYIVLTRNTVDFEKVPRLKFEDWTTTLPDKPR